MNGLAIAAAPLGAAGLGTLTEHFPGARPEAIRIDAALAIMAEAAEVRAAGEADLRIGRER
jgi:2C-methyl-D-erythritol 2,4-cyclodiphosphate synthase